MHLPSLTRDEDTAKERPERAGANGCEHRAHLPCRRSWVRVPSSAPKTPVNRGFCLGTRQHESQMSPKDVRPDCVWHSASSGQHRERQGEAAVCRRRRPLGTPQGRDRDVRGRRPSTPHDQRFLRDQAHRRRGGADLPLGERHAGVSVHARSHRSRAVESGPETDVPDTRSVSGASTSSPDARRLKRQPQPRCTVRRKDPLTSSLTQMRRRSR